MRIGLLEIFFLENWSFSRWEGSSFFSSLLKCATLRFLYCNHLVGIFFLLCFCAYVFSDAKIMHKEAMEKLFSNPRVACRGGCGSMYVLWWRLLLLLPMVCVFTVITVMHHHLRIFTVISTVFLFVSIHLGIHWFARSHL